MLSRDRGSVMPVSKFPRLRRLADEDEKKLQLPWSMGRKSTAAPLGFHWTPQEYQAGQSSSEVASVARYCATCGCALSRPFISRVIRAEIALPNTHYLRVASAVRYTGMMLR